MVLIGGRYFSKNSGAICYLICLNLLDLEADVAVTRNHEGFVVLSFVPTDERMNAFRHYVNAFRIRTELQVDIVAYNSIFNLIRHKIDAYKISQGIKK